MLHSHYVVWRPQYFGQRRETATRIPKRKYYIITTSSFKYLARMWAHYTIGIEGPQYPQCCTKMLKCTKPILTKLPRAQNAATVVLVNSTRKQCRTSIVLKRLDNILSLSCRVSSHISRHYYEGGPPPSQLVLEQY